MEENQLYRDYRLRFLLDMLRDQGETDFESVIDFGCGDGKLFESLVEAVGASRATGLDYRAPIERSRAGLTYEQTNFLDVNPTERFQLVTSIQVFEHIYEPWLERYFGALKRCCADGGTVLISTPNRWRPSNLIRAATLRNPRMMNANPGVPAEEHLGHHRESSYREFSQILHRFFPASEWGIHVARPLPRRIGSTLRWGINLAVYTLLWWAWRPLCVSASHDHYAIVRRR